MNSPAKDHGSPTLKRTYVLVGIVGVVLLAFIYNSLTNANRLRELTSPLWSSVNEIKLESAAVQYEVTDLLKSEVETYPKALWVYLDQSLWHLSNLLKSKSKSRHIGFPADKQDYAVHVKALTRQLAVLKAAFREHLNHSQPDGTIDVTTAHFDGLFAEFNRQIDDLEAEISQVMAFEQRQQIISHVVLMIFGIAMIGMLLFQMNQYDRYRKKNYRTLETTNVQLRRQIEERHRAEDALKESERLFRTIVNTCPDGILLGRLADGTVVDINPGFTELTGYTKDEVLAKTSQSCPIYEKPLFGEIFQLATQTGRAMENVELSIPMKNGRMKTVLISANTVELGQEPHLVVATRDISDLKVAENELRLSYELMKIANENRNMKKMLGQFIDVVQSYTRCSQCVIRLIDENNQIYDAAPTEPRPSGCADCDQQTAYNQCMCASVINRSIDQTCACMTEFGSFFKQNPGCELADKPIGCSNATIRCTRFDFGTLALVPIRVENRTIGLLQIADERQNRLSPAMVKFMEAAAMHMGTAIRRLRTEEGLENAYLTLEKRVQSRTHELSVMNQELQAEINERRQIEFRLRKNRNTLQTVIDGIDDSLILLDRDMKIRMLNRMAAKTYQIGDIDKVLGKFCFNEIGSESECDECEIMRAVSRREAIHFERSSGTDGERIERIAVYPVRQADDQPGGTIIRISDITEEKRFEKQLIQSEKMASLGVLVASIGHEINNPNNFIYFNIPILREYLEMLVRISDQYAEKHPNFELFHMTYNEFRKDVFKLVDNIEHGASRISSFVKNLRDFAKGNITHEKVWLDMSSIIEKVLSICRSQIKKHIRNFEVIVPDNLPKIYADEYSLEQILLNLIVNAVQAADKADSSVKLSVTAGESWLEKTVITVLDNGCGIDDDNLDNIFNPFYTTKPASEGTGLGLYVCHNLVQRLGGRIEVKSRKGQGSTFSIFLPDKDRRSKQRN